MARDRASGGWAPHPLDLQVRAFPVDTDGNPAGAGTLLACAALDLGHYCAAEAVRPRAVALAMR